MYISIYICTIVRGCLKGTTTVHRLQVTLIKQFFWVLGTSMYPRIHLSSMATGVPFKTVKTQLAVPTSSAVPWLLGCTFNSTGLCNHIHSFVGCIRFVPWVHIMYSQGWSPREYIKLHKGYKSPLLLDTCMKKMVSSCTLIIKELLKCCKQTVLLHTSQLPSISM